VTSPPGTWYLVEPSRGRVAPGQAKLQLETAPIGGTGPNETVLAATMNDEFSLFPNASFPVYSLSRDGGDGAWRMDGGGESACQGTCAVYWSPVLTSMWPEAGPGVDQHALGTVLRPDGSQQVTYNNQPLYLFYKDAYIPGLIGSQGINGAGMTTPWGVCNTISPTTHGCDPGWRARGWRCEGGDRG
jgi:predicted lipoprotein with Yx(FWY)xxD motif